MCGGMNVSLKKVNYDDIRDKIQPGDIIAFSGKGFFSEIIKCATRSNVSHTAIVLQSKILINNIPQKDYINQIIESISSGVSISRLSDRINSSNEIIWWLPLKDEIRKEMDFYKFFDFLLNQKNTPYDMGQIMKAGFDLFDNSSVQFFKKLTYNTEDLSKLFCSELAAAALEKGLEINKPSFHLNASEVTPIDLCMFNIFTKDYYQLKGEYQIINGYNTISPIGWGE